MSSRLTRALLKLYPRRIVNRYGGELLELQDELRAQGDVSRVGLVRDMLAGALAIRPARKASLVIGTVFVVAALAAGGAALGGGGANLPARASHPGRWFPFGRARVQSAKVIPYGTCFVAGGSPCSLAPCAEFVGQPSPNGAVYSIPGPVSRQRVTATRCASYPGIRPHRAVLVSG